MTSIHSQFLFQDRLNPEILTWNVFTPQRRKNEAHVTVVLMFNIFLVFPLFFQKILIKSIYIMSLDDNKFKSN